MERVDLTQCAKLLLQQHQTSHYTDNAVAALDSAHDRYGILVAGAQTRKPPR